MLFSCILPVLLFLCNWTAAFTVSVPSSVFVRDQFLTNWTSNTADSTLVVIVLNDEEKAPGCPLDTSKRERSYVVLDISNRAGSVGFYVDHPGTYQICAFTYVNNPSQPPVTTVNGNIAKSDSFNGSLLATTVTLEPSSSSIPTSSSAASGNDKSSIAGPVIGGVIGGIAFLMALLLLILFKWRDYRVIRLPPDSPSDSSHPLIVSTHSRAPSTNMLPDVSNIHPGVSPFPRPSHTPSHSTGDVVTGKRRNYQSTFMDSSTSGAGASSLGAMSPEPVPRKEQKRAISTETGGVESQSATGMADTERTPPVYVQGAGSSGSRAEKERDIMNQ
ncbi:hypothetical protein V5O48_017523 [Marasmius crinis-equi]|uniref:Uncharacterized protein n=1 Tax=Marasmius crinis-equi TaxID=585013 RepID=A0ABR3ENR0_9AGAR